MTRDSPSLINYFAVYENPWISASNRCIIRDLNELGKRMGSLDVPRPFTMLLGRWRGKGQSAAWFKALRIWSELGEVCESESFDGTRTSVIEHTMHVLLLPGLHTASPNSPGTSEVVLTESQVEMGVLGGRALGTVSRPQLVVPYANVTVPGRSPLHLQLRVITRLSFNEQGRVARHRDFVDVKDLLSLIPGAGAVQWLAATAAARGVAVVGALIRRAGGRGGPDRDRGLETEDEGEYGRGLGLSGYEAGALLVGRERSPQRAPDVDRD
ncbi:hypothetical protein SISSUDRAFT_795563 [Sistotremastrum suecicum HHB10207 ss-3]|uniref:Uncharacterized protein n=1 Tax=Sistotremastrum suecicum HHB10207 ss-3 TaxID=1314776 RepID=A0A166HP64_9AGAM|nr:hypothetical protein SISSUDRAFT_795563 [Sistotremastrum suecicum HHB10207 ss-3]